MNSGDQGEPVEGPIVPNKDVSEIRQEPYTMPNGFEWSQVAIERDSEDLKELYTLLTNNYVEDGAATFRFDYSMDFLYWALATGTPEFLFGVRSSKSGKLVAFISGIPATAKVYDHDVQVVEINYLCVHKKLRSKRLAPVLIKEITRRVNLTGVFQAVYTAGTVLPGTVASCTYYHRSLNIKKLVQTGFTQLPPSITLARMQKMYKLPGTPTTEGLRPMEEDDVSAVHMLLNTYLEQFSLKVVFSPEEVAHWLLPRKSVVSSYVVPDGKGQVTDLISFYHLPSTVLNQQEKLFAAYSYYNVATSVNLEDLMRDALVLAKNEGADVFNALNLMENGTIFDTLRFGKGDGNLQYYVYNWGCRAMPPEKVGIVLL